MKTLVIGATGLLGNALVRELLTCRKEVKVTIRQDSPKRSIDILKRLGVETVYADMRDKESMAKTLDNIRDVYLTAALFKTWLPNLKEFERTNREGVKNILELCYAKGIRRVVYTSSHGTIGLVEYPGYADEGTPLLKNQFDISPYLKSKYNAEVMARQYQDKGLDVIIVNPAGIIGINDFHDNPTNKYIRSAAEGKIPKFYLDAYVCLVDSRDAAKGHILAMEKGRKGQRYILGGDNITFREYFNYLARLANVRQRQIRVPTHALLFLSYFVSWKAALTSGMPALTPGSVKFLMRGTRYSCKKAEEELGYRFRPIWESIDDVYQWFKGEAAAKQGADNA